MPLDADTKPKRPRNINGFHMYTEETASNDISGSNLIDSITVSVYSGLFTFWFGSLEDKAYRRLSREARKKHADFAVLKSVYEGGLGSKSVVSIEADLYRKKG
ncbi:MAG: hypothetical protein HY518_00720 [Candidatus Aenigmarchaeota archaeon]|nr:hypothetical protein [Candidatus Aenigmarchaeota archaeon]